MGIDLHLLPFDCDLGDLSFSHTVLNCTGADFYDDLLNAPSMKVPDGFTSFLCRDDEFDGSHYGVTVETPYGEPLMFVEVESLLKFSDHPDTQVGRNKAIWAYLKALKPRTKVALFWH